MTSLAAELDTRVSSLYNHVANLEDLRASIQVRAMRLLGEHVRRAAMGHAGADGLRVLSHELRAFARSNPQRYAAITRPPIDPRGVLRRRRRHDRGARRDGALRRAAPRTGCWPTGMAVFAALHGFVSLEVAGYFGDVEDDLDAVYEMVIRGAVTAAVLEATH